MHTFKKVIIFLNVQFAELDHLVDFAIISWDHISQLQQHQIYWPPPDGIIGAAPLP